MAQVLSPKRKQILDCISESIRDRGYPPSVREIGETVGLTSSSTVHAHLAVLQRESGVAVRGNKPGVVAGDGLVGKSQLFVSEAAIDPDDDKIDGGGLNLERNSDGADALALQLFGQSGFADHEGGAPLGSLMGSHVEGSGVGGGVDPVGGYVQVIDLEQLLAVGLARATGVIGQKVDKFA